MRLNKLLAIFFVLCIISMSILVGAMKTENDRLNKIINQYTEIERKNTYISGCIYGGGSFETCTNAYYSAFLPRVKE